MKITYEIEKSTKGFVYVNEEKYSWDDAAYMFRSRVYYTFICMQKGSVSKRIKIAIENVCERIYKIEENGDRFVYVEGKKYKWTDAANEFETLMHDTFRGMQDRKVSKKIKVTVEEV